MTAVEQRFRERIGQSDFSDELFFPAGLSAWEDGRYRLKRAERGGARTRISGVRFLPAAAEDKEPERQCRRDVVQLVEGVTHLRAVEGYEDVVLGDTLRHGGRTKFGLERGRPDDPGAARACHRRIRRAIGRAGLAIEHPREFDPAQGMDGLHAWASELRLRRRRRIPPWLLLLPLLLLLLLLDWGDVTGPAERFFGVPIETSSLIVLVDKSNSMTPHFPVVQAEAKNVLQRMLSSGDKHFANVIAYDQAARSALDGMREVSDATLEALMGFLDGLASGGGTNLRAGLVEAAAQVARHEQPTTLVILTDGQDASIRAMLARSSELLKQFQGVEIVGNALTPRLFGGGGDPAPRNDAEEGLRDLAAALNGRFGPEQDT